MEENRDYSIVGWKKVSIELNYHDSSNYMLHSLVIIIYAWLPFYMPAIKHQLFSSASSIPQL
jgi:hypothetical protein